MGEHRGGARARFAWHELVSGDTRGEKALYASLFGWEVLPIEHELGVLDPISHRDVNIGGFRSPRTGFEVAHWLACVAVGDLEDSVERVNALGGVVLTPRMAVPGVGELSVVQDPQGASLGLLEVTGTVPASSLRATAGVFCWDELVCPAAEAAAAFYGQLFGWGVRPAEDRPGSWVFTDGDILVGGVTAAPESLRLPPAWLPYICTADLRASVRRARALRFRVAVPRFDLSKFGSAAMIRDRDGATLGLFQPPEWLRREWCPPAEGVAGAV
jgi:predicted enzyme related to lactoylglutathione lyase